ncbi:hypothetical protein SUGI_0071700 [Cryptomeria japonica]|nr:hypothetical protein SUGI_0071700 [Cryptomeria japonica]
MESLLRIIFVLILYNTGFFTLSVSQSVLSPSSLIKPLSSEHTVIKLSWFQLIVLIVAVIMCTVAVMSAILFRPPKVENKMQSLEEVNNNGSGGHSVSVSDLEGVIAGLSREGREKFLTRLHESIQDRRILIN